MLCMFGARRRLQTKEIPSAFSIREASARSVFSNAEIDDLTQCYVRLYIGTDWLYIQVSRHARAHSQAKANSDATSKSYARNRHAADTCGDRQELEVPFGECGRGTSAGARAEGRARALAW